MENPESTYTFYDEYTIISDRYSGTYSGAKWLAFKCAPDDIPWGVDAGDVECRKFWQTLNPECISIGKGNDPNGALEDLLGKLK